MNLLVNSTNTIWTTTFTTASNSITLSGNNNIPMDISSLDSVYDVTQKAAFNFAALQFTWYRANGLPIYNWVFNALPNSAAGSDTLNALFNIPQNQADFIQEQKTGTGSAGSPGTFVGGETPTGTINGTNTVFTLANTPNGGIALLLKPSGGSDMVLLNVVQSSSVEPEDYNISGNTITFVVPPPTGASIFANYFHN